MVINLLFTRSKKPCRYDCGSLARKLIMVYPFMKDDLGNGYVSVFILSGRSFIIYYLLPAHASEQGNVIGLGPCIYIRSCHQKKL